MNDAEEKSQIVSEVYRMASWSGDPKDTSRLRKHRKAIELATETGIDKWLPDYEGMEPEVVKCHLAERIKPIVLQRMKERKQDYGFIMVITMGMLFTWILQAIVVTAVAALVNWWITRKLENGQKLSRLCESHRIAEQ